MSRKTLIAFVCKIFPKLKKIFIFSFALLLASCSIGGIDVEQESASGLAGELLDGRSFGQTFKLHSDGLYRLDLYTATYARENTQSVVLRICSSPACKKGTDEKTRIELPATQISNSGPTVITFPPITGIVNQTLYLSIESPGSIPGNAITIYRDEKDIYPDGSMYIDGQPTKGDIAFIAYTKEAFTLSGMGNDFYVRANQDKPFFIFYCSTLIVLLGMIFFLVMWGKKA